MNILVISLTHIHTSSPFFSPGGIYNGLWTQQQRLRPNDAYISSSGNLYGEKMDLHGKTLVITQNRQKTHGTNSGTFCVFSLKYCILYMLSVIKLCVCVCLCVSVCLFDVDFL